MISAKFVPLKYYTLSSQLRRLTSFSVGLFGSANSVTRSYPVMRKSCIMHFNICMIVCDAVSTLTVCIRLSTVAHKAVYMRLFIETDRVNLLSFTNYAIMMIFACYC